MFAAAHRLDLGFSSFWSIKSNPHNKVGREILEAVNLPCWDEDKRTCHDFMTSLSIKKHSLAACDKINFISRVWLLWVIPDWGVKLNDE